MSLLAYIPKTKSVIMTLYVEKKKIHKDYIHTINYTSKKITVPGYALNCDWTGSSTEVYVQSS